MTRVIAEETYARAGGPPTGWQNLNVVDVATGHDVQHVLEVDCAGGWLLRYFVGPDGKDRACTGEPPCPLCERGEPAWHHLRVERLEGRFRLEREVDE